jgi:hypothetical protein
MATAQETKEVKYEVKFGSKKESDRETKTFTEQDKAIEFFKEKDKAGFHVDAYEVETVVKRKKLTT